MAEPRPTLVKENPLWILKFQSQKVATGGTPFPQTGNVRAKRGGALTKAVQPGSAGSGQPEPRPPEFLVVALSL